MLLPASTRSTLTSDGCRALQVFEQSACGTTRMVVHRVATKNHAVIHQCRQPPGCQAGPPLMVWGTPSDITHKAESLSQRLVVSPMLRPC